MKSLPNLNVPRKTAQKPQANFQLKYCAGAKSKRNRNLATKPYTHLYPQFDLIPTPQPASKVLGPPGAHLLAGCCGRQPRRLDGSTSFENSCGGFGLGLRI